MKKTATEPVRRAERPSEANLTRSGFGGGSAPGAAAATLARSCGGPAGRWCGSFGGRTSLPSKGQFVGSVIKKRRKRMAKKKHRKLLKKTRVQRRKLGK